MLPRCCRDRRRGGSDGATPNTPAPRYRPEGSTRRASHPGADPPEAAIPTRVLLLALLLLLVACRRGAENPEDLQLQLDVSPRRTGPAVAVLALRQAGEPVVGAEIELEANMNHAGMRPSLARFVEAEPGVYRADFRFTMGGDWFVEVRGTLPDGHPFREVRQVPAVAP